MKRCFFFGCSFTEGSEICDNELLGISREDCDKLKRKMKLSKFYDYMYDIVQKKYQLQNDRNIISDFVRNNNIEKSWAKHLSIRLDMDCVNLARGGTGHEFLICELERTIDMIDSDDIVFIGLTSPDRYLVIDDNWNPVNKLLNTGKHPFDVFTEKTIIWNYWRQVRHISLLLNSRNIQHYFVPVFLSEIWSWESNNSNIGNLVDKFKDSITPRMIPLRSLKTELIYGLPHPPKVCPYETGYEHVYEEGHILYANLVYEQLKNNFSGEFNENI